MAQPFKADKIQTNELATTSSAGIGVIKVSASLSMETTKSIEFWDGTTAMSASKVGHLHFVGINFHLSGTAIATAMSAAQITGSLTLMADGRSFLAAGTNATVTTGSDGQVTISGGGGNTIDQSYDQGGAGVGAIVTVDGQPIQLQGNIGADALSVTSSFSVVSKLVTTTSASLYHDSNAFVIDPTENKNIRMSGSGYVGYATERTGVLAFHAVNATYDGNTYSARFWPITPNSASNAYAPALKITFDAASTFLWGVSPPVNSKIVHISVAGSWAADEKTLALIRYHLTGTAAGIQTLLAKASTTTASGSSDVTLENISHLVEEGAGYLVSLYVENDEDYCFGGVMKYVYNDLEI